MTDVIKTSIRQYGSGIETSLLNLPEESHIFSALATTPQAVECSVLHGDNDPNWKAKLKRGDGVVTYLSGSNLNCTENAFFTGQHVIQNDVHGTTRIRRFWGDAATLCDVPSPPEESAVSQADNTAKMVFIKKATEAQRALQGLVALGELRQTLNLIRNPLKALRSSVDRLTNDAWKRRRKFRDIYKDNGRGGKEYRKEFRTAMADTYLEWAFGAQPLVSDVISGAEAASRIMTYHPPSIPISGRGQASSGVVDVKSALQGGNGLRCEYTIRRSTAASVRYYGSVWTSVPGLNGMSGQLGVRLMDVIPAVWELIPYSFLVDYFTNAQEIVNAACFPASAIRWQARGQKLERCHELTAANCTFVGGLSYGDVIQENNLTVETGCKTLRSEIIRYVYEGAWIPSLEFQVPGLSSKKWLNIAALAASGRRFNGTNRL